METGREPKSHSVTPRPLHLSSGEIFLIVAEGSAGVCGGPVASSFELGCSEKPMFAKGRGRSPT